MSIGDCALPTLHHCAFMVCWLWLWLWGRGDLYDGKGSMGPFPGHLVYWVHAVLVRCIPPQVA